MPESEITLAPRMDDYFRDVVVEVVRERKIDATEAAVSYLVSLLCSYARPDADVGSTLTEPLTFLLRDALNAPGSVRFQRLRLLGDGVLYAMGFFGEHIDKKGVDRSYVLSVGSTAYDNASAMMRLGSHHGPDVLGELAAKFGGFVGVLSDVAEGTMARGARGSEGAMRLYERWLKTGSTRIAGELGVLGLMPNRGGRGLH